MKYSVLTLAALVVPCLGNPTPYWRTYFSRPVRPVRPADSGTVSVFNNLQFGVQVLEEPQGGIYNAPPGGPPVFIPGSFSADVKLNGQVEVSYTSGDQGTFNYVINPIGSGDFPGCISVSPNGCGAMSWCPGDPSTQPVTCPGGAELPISLGPSSPPL
jgi:hypothetical protein